MALFMKQDFAPPILSRRWLAMKLRPNKLIHSHSYIISILESGLLFREDCAEVEQESPSPEEVWVAGGGGRDGWFTRGEYVGVAVCVAVVTGVGPVRRFVFSRPSLSLTPLPLPLLVRATLRRLSRRTALDALLSRMCDYVALARRAAACLKEFSAVHKELSSISSVLTSMRALLSRQQRELSVLLSRASSALLGNVPWIRSDVAWEAVDNDMEDNLLKIHHTFLVVQSTFLKHVAMAHYIPSVNAQRIYKNHNERLHWIHSILLNEVYEQFTANFESLDRMYRLLKNYGNVDLNNKTLGRIVNDSWLYSEIHSGVAKTNLELKIALNKCTSLDMFLDSCAVNKQTIDLEVLNKDIDDLIDRITKSLTTAQNSQLRLQKLKSKFGEKKKKENVEEKVEEKEVEEANVVYIVDKEPETRDEVFYFVKTDDDNEDSIQPAADVTTHPGRKEKETTKIVLNELKRKLVRREDLMRERERQALVNTMPEYKNKLPEFPRQIEIDEKTGYITKLKKQLHNKKKLFLHYKIQKSAKKSSLFRRCHDLDIKSCTSEDAVNGFKCEVFTNFKPRIKRLFSFEVKKPALDVIKQNNVNNIPQNDTFESLSDGFSGVETNASNITVNHAVNQCVNIANQEGSNLKFSKEDLELSTSDSDIDFCEENKMALLQDVRKHRAVRKKNYPGKRASIQTDEDESLKPVQYSFGTGMAMASVLQVNSHSHGNFGNLSQEEVFIGDGEVSEDSGNDDE